MKQANIKCPYCGSGAFLRPASVLHKENGAERNAMFYVCARYPSCDAYVRAHDFNRQPMGTLADPVLRRKRQEAHQALRRLWESGLMSKKEAYRWLQTQLGIDETDAHIAKFSELRCEAVIRLCGSFPQLRRAA